MAAENAPDSFRELRRIRIALYLLAIALLLLALWMLLFVRTDAARPPSETARDITPIRSFGEGGLKMRVVIRTGGQSGVDRAALDFAIRRGLPYGGWCPQGGWAEDHKTAPGVLAAYPRLTETPSATPEQRTAWNVRDSHATLILVQGDSLGRSPGTVFTRQCAELVFLRPCLVVDMTAKGALAMASDWLARTTAGAGVAELWLNVAGPRESQSEPHHGSIYVEASRFLDALLP